MTAAQLRASSGECGMKSPFSGQGVARAGPSAAVAMPQDKDKDKDKAANTMIVQSRRMRPQSIEYRNTRLSH